MAGPTLRPVTSVNVDAACALRVSPDQARHVEPVARSLALAYTVPTTAWPRLVYVGEEPVAFVMAFHDVRWPGDPSGTTRSGVWRLNVDVAHQGKGYGRFAVEGVCADLAARGEHVCFVTWHPSAGGPGAFYSRLGFRPTGELSGDQVVARRGLT